MLSARHHQDRVRCGVRRSQLHSEMCIRDSLLDEQDAPLTEADQKLVQTVAGFLGRQMEN